jgi:hypothetical protein
MKPGGIFWSLSEPKMTWNENENYCCLIEKATQIKANYPAAIPIGGQNGLSIHAPADGLYRTMTGLRPDRAIHANFCSAKFRFYPLTRPTPKNGVGHCSLRYTTRSPGISAKQGNFFRRTHTSGFIIIPVYEVIA